MAKLSNPNARQSHIDEPRTNFGKTQKYTSGNAANDMRHNHIKSGPEPGEKSGHAPASGPHKRGFGGR
jgi:hypothetical protein